MKNFRELRVWQAAIDLVEKIYFLTRGLPKEELYGLVSQLRRVAVSVPSKIAEGHTREHLGEYLHHLSFAQGSLAEIETQIEIALRLRYITPKDASDLFTDISALGKQMYSLRNSLSTKRSS
jgi:four helix bundle protein